MDRVDVILTFDVEDVFHPPEEDHDGLIVWMAEALTEHGLPGNFLLIGDKARWIKDHGRDDVVEALRPHEVGTHTLTGAHPTNAEICAGVGWDEGLKLVKEREEAAAEILREVFGRGPAAISIHNYWWAPQLGRVAAEMGVPLVYGYAAAPPKYSLSQYCGGLIVPASLTHPPYTSFFDGFDDSYSDDGHFEARLARLNEHIGTCLKGEVPLFVLLMCHPLKVRCIDWIDAYQYPDGRNIPRREWGKRGRPRLRSAERMKTARKNFGRLCWFLRDCEALHPMRVSELAGKYWDRPAVVEKKDLMEIAGRVAGEADADTPRSEVESCEFLPLPARMTPAQALVGMAQSVLVYRENGAVPDRVPCRDVLGPMEVPTAVPEVWMIGLDEIRESCAKLLACVDTSGHLPHRVDALGAGSLFQVVSRSYLDAVGGGGREWYRPCVMPRYPESGDKIGYLANDISRSEMADPGMDFHRVLTYSRLQSWTLRPSWTPLCDEGRRSEPWGR